MGLGYPLLRVRYSVRFVRRPVGRRDVDDRHDTPLRMDDCQPTIAAFPGQTSSLRHRVSPGAGHSGALQARLPVVGRHLSSAYRQSRCRSEFHPSSLHIYVDVGYIYYNI